MRPTEGENAFFFLEEREGRRILFVHGHASPFFPTQHLCVFLKRRATKREHPFLFFVIFTGKLEEKQHAEKEAATSFSPPLRRQLDWRKDEKGGGGTGWHGGQ